MRSGLGVLSPVISGRFAPPLWGSPAAAVFFSRRRAGRRNRYTIRTDLPVPDVMARNRPVGDLLAILTAPTPV